MHIIISLLAIIYVLLCAFCWWFLTLSKGFAGGRLHADDYLGIAFIAFVILAVITVFVSGFWALVSVFSSWVSLI